MNKRNITGGGKNNRHGDERNEGLEKYMEYIPEKRDQDSRMATILQQQVIEVLICQRFVR